MRKIWETWTSWDGRHYLLMGCKRLPTSSEWNQFNQQGLRFEGFLPPLGYLVSVPEHFSRELFSLLSGPGSMVQALVPVDPLIKLSSLLVRNGLPHLDLDADGRVSLHVLLFQNASAQKWMQEWAKRPGIEWVKSPQGQDGIALRAEPSWLPTLLQHPAVLWVEPGSQPGLPEDREARTLHRGHAIDNLLIGGRRFDGDSVVVGIADDGAIGPHIDFKGRLTQYTTNQAAANTHGDMVAGISVGNGNLNPTRVGAATKAYLHMYGISGYPHVSNAVTNLNTLGTTLTSTSYSEVNGGLYNSSAVSIDAQLNSSPLLMHVFSAGNAGTSDHGYGAGTGWGNITGGYKAGKNVIAVGNLRNTDSLENSSSRGPARDGRIKPDICANGYNQMSTGPNNTYQVGGGTSAASPSIMGTMAQISHAYRTFNGTRPPAALLKAAVLNTAEDLGNPGPDFRFGWGRINALRAVDLLQANRYQTGTLNQGDSQTLVLDIPPLTRQLRVMLYWADRAGVANATRALVNNLDLRVLQPGGSLALPLVLNPTPTVAALNATAIPGLDSLNNVEQVRILNPVPGNYTVQIHGTAVAQGPQTYWVVYEWHTDQIKLTYPMGGERFVVGETEIIRWDATGNTGNFTVQWSNNNGTTWNNLATNLGPSVRHTSWVVPSTTGGQYKIRVLSGSIADESAQPFSVSPAVTGLAFGYICPTELGLVWSPVSGAGQYIVHRLGTHTMDSIGTTSGTSFTVSGTNLSSEDWYAVTAVGTANAWQGRRSLAVAKPLNTTTGCQTAPVAGFGGSVLQACLNQTVTLLDQSQNNPTTWQWSITPASFVYVNNTNASTRNPQVQFTANGTYSVTLVVGNQFGNDTLLRAALISVGQGQSLPVSVNFSGLALPSDWTLENPDTAATWVYRSGIGPAGTTTTMAWMNFFSYNSRGQEDRLVSPILDLSNANPQNTWLTFDLAYAPYNTTYVDRLRVDVSSDCGTSYTLGLYDKSGTALGTVPASTTAFTPTSAGQWRKDSVNLGAYAGQRIRLRMTAVNDYGNNLYLTNLQVNSSGQPAGLPVGGRLVYANNASSSLSNVVVNLKQNNTVVAIDTTDALGQFNLGFQAPGSYTLEYHTNKPWGGVNATDALGINRHFGNLAPLVGLPMMAADANNSGAVNSTDALMVSRRFSNIIAAFPLEDWVWGTVNLQLVAGGSYNNLLWQGLCAGDVNASYSPPGP
ncbi:MAG: S8 family serine peptidase [Bacteroidia bacterium]